MRIANRTAVRVGLATVAAGAIAAGALSLVSSAGALGSSPSGTAAGAMGTHAAADPVYGFRTIDNATDLTFNQLLGINDNRLIAGYFGSGAQGHPNMGYLLQGGGYRNENFPGSVQTQVTGLNDNGVTVGFWSGMNTSNMMNDNFGFYAANGSFHNVNFPTGANASPPVNQLLGVNDSDVAVGFYTDAKGSNHGYEYDISDGRFSRVLDPASSGASLTAAAINDHGDVAGFYTGSGTRTDAFLKTAGGRFTSLAYPGASATNAFGVNGNDEVVGSYTDGSGNSATTHGFTWTPQGGFASVDDPEGHGATTINGVNDHGDLVGFYTDAKGNTDGFVATPATPSVTRLQLQAMPAGTATFVWTAAGQLTAQVSVSGLTPGSSHAVELQGPDGATIAQFGILTANGVGQAEATLDSTDTTPVPDGSHLVILIDGQMGAIASEPIAQTPAIAAGQMSYQLLETMVGPTGISYGTPRGWATVAYDPQAAAITVTLTASGLTPGAHAAHIHVGSCQSQGPVQYMLMDFTADASGRINGEVRTVTGVTMPVPATGWYLNLHQGTSANIAANGQPTVNFRPLLCADL
ncbi:MAG TPA: CHRD domain-containing protein [Streptosporangiaceae bacterium]